jgi:hypothetical protein
VEDRRRSETGRGDSSSPGGCAIITSKEHEAMPIDSTPAKRLNELAQTALAFFEEARNKPSNAWRMSEWTWGRFSKEQQATAERLGRDLRQQLALLESKMRLCWISGTWRASRSLVEQWTPRCDSNRFAPAAWRTRGPPTYSKLPITRFGGCWISCPRRVLLQLSLLASQFEHLTNLQRRPLGRSTRQSAAGEINVATGLRWTTGCGLAASRVKSQGTLFPSQSVIGEINVATELQETVGSTWQLPVAKAKSAGS